MKIALMVFLLIFSASIKADGHSVYAGLELQIRNMGVKSSNIGTFTNASLQPHVLAGFKLNEKFGLEAGANICRFKRTGKNPHKTNALHLSAVGYHPLSDKITLLGGIGASRVAGSYSNHTVSSRVKKVVPRGLVGLQYSIVDGLDVRASLVHEKTNKLRNSFIKSKDSTSYGLGVIQTF